MNINNYKDFIGVYENVYADGFCQHMISEFNRLEHHGAGRNRIQSEGADRHIKDDFQIVLGLDSHHVRPFEDKKLLDVFFNGLQECYDHYITKYSSLQNMKLKSTMCKLQRTDPGQGYHIWHCEQGSTLTASRVLTFILYLNTLQPEEAGETEFLYQQSRYRPVENTMVIWPAAYTHTHRGNTVFGNKSKYIATGWFYLE